MPTIKFLPFNEQTAAFAPAPEPASKFLPEWYKKQPAYMDEMPALRSGGTTSTIKRCMPIFDVLTSGYMLSFPTDILINTNNPDKIEWSVPISMKRFASDMISKHTQEQVSHYPVDTNIYHKEVFRILPFWSVQTPPGYSTLFTQPFHRDGDPFKAFSAIVDTDTFVSDGHLSMHLIKNYEGVIKRGTPFVQVIPFKREEWQMELEDSDLASKIVGDQRLKIRSMFKQGYKDFYRSKKEFK